MLIPLATVGVLAAQDALKGTPEQGITKPNSGSEGQKHPQSQAGDQSAYSTMPSSPQPSAPTCDEACQQARDNLQVQHRLAWFTGLLVVVGGLQAGTMIWQAWLLKGTKEKIQVQAGHMEDQSKTLRESVAAAQKAADAAEISAKAAIGVAVPTLMLYKFEFINEGREHPATFYGYPRVRLKLRNYGQSPAFLRKYAIGYL